jgi:hypothetical protein
MTRPGIVAAASAMTAGFQMARTVTDPSETGAKTAAVLKV